MLFNGTVHKNQDALIKSPFLHVYVLDKMNNPEQTIFHHKYYAAYLYIMHITNFFDQYAFSYNFRNSSVISVLLVLKC